MAHWCANGKQMQFEGERGIYFICQKGSYEGNQCPSVRWCGLSNHWVMNERGQGCQYYEFSNTDKKIDENN